MKKQNSIHLFAFIVLNLFLVSQTFASSLEDRVITSGPNSGKKLIDIVSAHKIKGHIDKGRGHSWEHIPAKAITEAFNFYDRFSETARQYDSKMSLRPCVDPKTKVQFPAPCLSGLVQKYKGPTIANKRYIIIFDMNLHRTVHRFHIIDLETGTIESMTAAHGMDSDCGGYACKFADNTTFDPDLEDKDKVTGAESSPLGFFVTGPEFVPSGPLKHKYGIFLNGLEKNSGSFEGNDIPDALVMHDADYVSENDAGRSWGCVALSESNMERWKDSIANGALIYFYHDKIEKFNRTPAVSGLINH